MFSEVRRLHLDKALLALMPALIPPSAAAERLNKMDLLPSIPTQLRVAELSSLDYGRTTDLWLKMLRHSAGVRSLTMLSIETSAYESMAKLGLFLQDVGPNLRYLRFSINHWMLRANGEILSECKGLFLRKGFSLRYL